MRFVPHNYQQTAIDHIIEQPKCALFLDMGMGKTVSVLTAIQHLRKEEFAVDKVLVIAPLRVARDTWTDEIAKWEHLRDLRCSLMLGTSKQRVAAFHADADIYIINRENVPWLINFCLESWPFDTVVIDELSSFKSATSGRFKKLRKACGKIDRVIGMTGTPTPNSLTELWPQVYLLDQGERLGKTATGFKARYFVPDKRGKAANGMQITYSYKPRETTEGDIFAKIGDICMSMKATDYLNMPDKIVVEREVAFTGEQRALYEEFEREQYLAFVESEAIALTKPALINKLLQFANGAMYVGEDRAYEIVSDAKLDALEDLIEAAQGHPVLVLYSYKHDVARIKARLGSAVHEFGDDTIREWNAGSIPVLLGHPASMGHGLNLQAGGHNIIWFGLTWSLELYEQANARLYRQGQQHPVVIQHLITKDTQEQRVLETLQGKRDVQDAVFEALARKYGK